MEENVGIIPVSTIGLLEIICESKVFVCSEELLDAIVVVTNPAPIRRHIDIVTLAVFVFFILFFCIVVKNENSLDFIVNLL